jgi:hypothetical protein
MLLSKECLTLYAVALLANFTNSFINGQAKNYAIAAGL